MLSNIYKKSQIKQKKGFTMVELIVVITITIIVMTLVVTGILGFIENGKQVNRTNIARTIYLATQNQLIQSKVERNLKPTLSGVYYEKGEYNYTDTIIPAQIAISNVSQALVANGGTYPQTDIENKDYVQYISKPRGYEHQGDGSEVDKLYELLDKFILDKSILNEAILIEYNINTGVVLSVFYGDAFRGGDTEFEYDDVNENSRINITGNRGMEPESGYTFAKERRQGYYGVDYTGEVEDPNLPDLVNIYDGMNKALNAENSLSRVDKVNILYGEFILPIAYGSGGNPRMPSYDFQIVNAKDNQVVFELTGVDLNSISLPNSFVAASTDPFSPEFFYQETLAPQTVMENGIDLSGSYQRYIWVLDYIEGDILTSQPHNIETTPQDLRAVAIKEQGATTRSVTIAHSHYYRELGSNGYEVKSARHLNNIRHLPTDSYRQTADIDMKLLHNEVTNFAPIPDFSGQYNAMKDKESQWLIKGLAIDTTVETLDESAIDTANIGLFANTHNATITGLSLFEGTVIVEDSANVGLIAGQMNGGTIRQSNSYSNITATGASVNVGGLVGHLVEGTLVHSFNGGFYNTHETDGNDSHLTHSDTGVGTIRAEVGNIGGLVGQNGGTIQDSFNNARVNIDDVSLTDETEYLSHTPIHYPNGIAANAGGIAGLNTEDGTIKNTYNTNHVSTEDGVTSGGIAGANEGLIEESYYIYNGCADSGGVYKEELRGMHNTLGAFVAGEAYQVGNNTYISYPYPTLKNNNPFATEELIWGWEDIEEAMKGSVEIFYYEFYDNDSWGYSTGGNPLVSNTSPRLVVNDGYGILFPVNRYGYTLILNGEKYILDLGGISNQIWSITKESDNGNSTIVWHEEAFTNAEGEQYYRLFIPNSIAEGQPTLSATLYIGTSVNMDTAEPIGSDSHSTPLFAIDGTIRSPRHLDNIDANAGTLGGSHTQQLNMDMSIYRKELNANGTVNGTTGLTFNQAVVSGNFTGSYNGNTRWIRNLTITATGNNVGLFSNISGSATRITLRNPSISGGSNVGAIAGTNSGSVTFCSVQQVVDQYEPLASHPYIVSGANNVGGVVGNNTGTLADVAVVSTSGKPAVVGTGSVVGGIAGISTSTIVIDRIQYLAIAPHTGSGVAVPYVGSGTVGNNCHYLSGSVALRPFTTMPQNTPQPSYNFMGGPHGAWNTLGMKNENPFINWSRTAVSDALATSGTNTVFPYAYPNGTVRPDVRDGTTPTSNLLEWPIADTYAINSDDGVIYYEKYADGTYGVFTRRFSNTPEHSDFDQRYIELDYLNPNGVIVEAGYGFNITVLRDDTTTNWNNNRRARVRQNGTGSDGWTTIGNNLDVGQRSWHFEVPNLDALFTRIPSEQLNNNIAIAQYINTPLQQVTIWVNSGQGNNTEPDPIGVASINPLFAKAVYPVNYDNELNGAINSGPVYPEAYSIRTPWQMQNITKGTSTNTSVGHTFIQEGNLDFDIAAGMSGVSPATITANVVTGTFQGTYDGNGLMISNLNLNNTTNNKGVFGTIGASGNLLNLTLVNCSFLNGGNNGSFASTNNGVIQDVVFINNNPTTTTNPTHITGTQAGGIVWTNTGTIQNALFLGVAPTASGNINPIAYANTGNASKNTYYLSGTINRAGTSANYNNANATSGGTRKTTQELNALNASGLVDWEFNDIWIPSRANITSNTMINTVYPYPNVGITTASWPVATIPANEIVYYEIYADETIGFHADNQGTLPELKVNLEDTEVVEIIEDGYLAFVPMSGGYSIKQGDTGVNIHVQAEQMADGTYYVKIPGSFEAESIASGQIYINDNHVATFSTYIKPLPPEEDEEDGEIDGDGTAEEGFTEQKVQIETYKDDIQFIGDVDDIDDGLGLITPTEEEISEIEQIREELKDAYLLVYFEEYGDVLPNESGETYGLNEAFKSYGAYGIYKTNESHENNESHEAYESDGVSGINQSYESNETEGVNESYEVYENYALYETYGLYETFGFYVNENLIPQGFWKTADEIEVLEYDAEILEKELEGMDYIREDIKLNKLRFAEELAKANEALWSEDESVLRSGYGILSAKKELTVLVDDMEVEVETIPYGFLYLHIIPEGEESTLPKVKAEDTLPITEGEMEEVPWLLISVKIEDQVIDLGLIRQDITKGINTIPEDVEAKGWLPRFLLYTGKRPRYGMDGDLLTT